MGFSGPATNFDLISAKALKLETLCRDHDNAVGRLSVDFSFPGGGLSTFAGAPIGEASIPAD